MTNRSSRRSTRSLVRIVQGVFATLSPVLVLTGCSFNERAPLVTEPAAGVMQITGHAIGGEQPVVGATIQVYAAGSGGYGATATPLLTSTVTTDSNGFFTVTGKYSCASVTTPVYITATGGNPGLTAGTNNQALKLAAAIGTCAQFQSTSYIWIDEITTAATAFALGQYFTTTYGAGSTDSFGAPSTTQAQLGLTNAVNTVANLVNSTNGTAIASATLTSSFGNITATPEATKLNTIADILSSCVNSDGSAASPCQTTLFPDVTPTGGTQPTDTLQAAVLLSLNPTSSNANGSANNMAALFGLQSATAPYPGLTTQPGDWTIGINYSAGSSSSNTLMNTVGDLAVDSGGNVWVLDTNTTGSLAEVSPTGTPLSNPLNSGSTPPTGLDTASPKNLAIDTNNNIFITSSSTAYNAVFEWNPTTNTPTEIAETSQPYGIAIDGSNNIWIGHNSNSAAASFSEFLNDSLQNWVQYPKDGSTNIGSFYLAIATDGTLWNSQGNSGDQVFQMSGGNGSTVCTTFPCKTSNASTLSLTYTQANNSNTSTPEGLAAGPGGSMWVINNATPNIALYTSPTTSTLVGSSLTLKSPRKIAIDGAGNAWVVNNGASFITEFNSTGVVLSPVGTSAAPNGFAHSGISSGVAIAIDPSGNVWIANNGGTDANSIFEIVGAAIPTVAPIALALKNGTVGARP
jgi:hypothetical protein